MGDRNTIHNIAYDEFIVFKIKMIFTEAVIHTVTDLRIFHVTQ